MSDRTPIYVVSETGRPLEIEKSNRRKNIRYFKFLIVPLLILVFFQSFLIMKAGLGKDHVSLNRPLKLRVYTNNIRYDNRGNRDLGEKPWTKRRTEVINSIDFHAGATGYANIVALQEVLHNQIEDIIAGLNKNAGRGENWTYFGVGRTDGEKSGEYAPILYKPSEWILVENQTFWLSPTPEVPSKGWDAALERIVTMVTLTSTSNPLVTLNFFNTHFDHRGELARRRSAQLIVDKMKNHNGYPSFLAGDFNTEPSDEPYAVLKSTGFKDSRVLIDPHYSYGELSTFTGFDHKNEVGTIIDYIWSPSYTKGNLEVAENELEDVSKEKNQADEATRFGVVLKHFGILPNYVKGFHFSDHRPVVANYEVVRKWF